MTATDTAPTRHAHRKLTQAELAAEAAARFGPNPWDWAFECPRCGDVATAKDFPEGMRQRLGQDCVGRHRGALSGPANASGRGRADRGCDWTAIGLIRGPWEVVMPTGETAWGFPLAPAPSQPPQSAAQTPTAPMDHPDADSPADATVGPGCGLSVERGNPGNRRTPPAEHALPEPEEWDYRVALGEHQAVLGYRDIEPDVPVTLLFADTSDRAHALADWTHALAPDLEAALRHIAAHELPITAADLTYAVLLIVEACAEDTAAAKSAPLPSEPYLTNDDADEA